MLTALLVDKESYLTPAEFRIFASFTSSFPYVLLPFFFGGSEKRSSPTLSWHSCLSPGSMVSPLVAIVVAGDSAAADEASGPLAGALGVAARAAGASPVPVPVPVAGAWDTAGVGDVITLVPVPVSALVPEKNVMIVARGAAAAATGGVEVADAFSPL